MKEESTKSLKDSLFIAFNLFNNQSYMNVMKTIYFIMNYFIQLSCMFLGWNTVNEFYLKPVKVKSKNRPNR